MEWLKDKKNLPIVIGLAVFVLLGAGGLIAFELGAFSGGSSEAPVAAQPPAVPPGGPPPGSVGSGPGVAGSPGLPPGMRPSFKRAGRPGFGTSGAALTPGAAPTMVASSVVKPKNTDPSKGPDPFMIPGGPKVIALGGSGAIPDQVGMKLPLSRILPPMNLFHLRPAALLAAPTLPGQIYGQNPASNYRLAGIINGADGNINAILEVGGQSQQVKPGDALPDGSRVLTIQSDSLTLKTGNGTNVSLPLSAGQDQAPTSNQFNGPPGYRGQPGFNGPPGYGGPPQGFMGQPPKDANGDN